MADMTTPQNQTVKAPPANNGVSPTQTAPKAMTFDQAVPEEEPTFEEIKQTPPEKKQKKATTETFDDEEDLGSEELDEDELGDEDEDSETEDVDDAEDAAEGDEEGDEADESDQEESPSDVLSDDELEKKLRVKIDGKWEEKSLKEWRNVIASGAHNLKTFRAWEARRDADLKVINEAKAQVGIANAKITPAWEKLKAKDVEGTIYELASTAGFNRLEVARRLREQMLPAIAQRLGLSEQDVRQRLTQMEPHNRALDIQERNEFLEAENKRIQEASKPKEPDAVAIEERKFQDMMVENGISRNELKWAYEWLHKKAPEGMMPNLSVEVVQNTIINRRFVEKAFDAIESRRPSLAKDEKFVDRTVRKLKKNPDWSVSKLATWVEKQARMASEEQKQTKVSELTREVSRKALQVRGKNGFTNPDVSQKKAMRFNDLIDDDQSSGLI